MNNRLRCGRIVWLVLLFFLPTIGQAQLAGSSDETKVSAFLSVDKLTPGSTFRIAVVIDLAEPWHINANNIKTEGLIPTTLAFQSSPSVSIDGIVYPSGERMKVEWADEPVTLYTGRTVIFVDARVKSDAPRGPFKLEGSLRYQACNDRLCIAPKNVPVILETEIAPGDYKPESVHSELFAAQSQAAPLPALVTAGRSGPESPIAVLVQQRGWFATFLVVFLGGLALNLTPCVYPMIAITVSYFGGQGGKRNTRHAFISSLIYCLGIVLTYSTLGLIAALSGSLFGSALQNPVVLIGIALLLVALALSMFGLYELQPPQFLMQKATGLSSKAGYIGIFLFGAVIGVIAAPCLAPFVVALLAFVGQSGSPWLGWWMFFALALGLGLPYVVLGTFSGLLTRLPKSGTWMIWVKRVFGVALLAVAGWITSPLWLEATASTSGGIVWEPYSVAKVQQAASEKRPVLIDFSAEWCGPCRKMERTTFRDKQVVEASKLFVTLKADLTHEGTPEVEKMRKDFGIWGVPTLVFIGPDGGEHTELRKVEYVSAAELLDSLEKAKKVTTTNTTVAVAPNVPPQLLNPF